LAHIFKGNPYAGKLQVPSGNWRAFAIGPESDFDLLRINGELLGPGRLLPLSVTDGEPKVEYVRGPKAAFRAANANFSDAPPGEPQAHLMCFDCDDPIVNPGPRPSRVYKFRNRGVAGDSSHVNEIVIPFCGRRHARIVLTLLSPSDDTRTIKWLVMGRLWLTDVDSTSAGNQNTSNMPGLAVGGSGGFPLTYVELDGGGTIAAPLTTADDSVVTGFVNGALTLDKAPVATSATVTNGKHVGGTDSAEYFDEISIVYWPDAAGTLDLAIDIEVTGEEGCA